MEFETNNPERNQEPMLILFFREQGNAKLCEDYEMLTRMVDSDENFLEVITYYRMCNATEVSKLYYLSI